MHHNPQVMVLHAAGLRVAGPADVPALARVINRAYVVEEFFVEGARTSEGDIAQRLAQANALFLVVMTKPLVSPW